MNIWPGPDVAGRMMKSSAKPKRRQTGPGRLSAEDAAKLPDRLLDAAAAMFLERGYAKATMEAIARKAQASTKTVYSRYANKAEILAAVIRRLVEGTLAEIDTDLEGKLDATDPQAFLFDIGLRFAALVSTRQTAGINRLVIAGAAEFPELALSYGEGPGRAAGIVRAALAQWQREGRLPLMPQPDIAATIFYDMATSTPRTQALLGRPLARAALETHVSTVVALFLRGCGHPDQPARHARRPVAKQARATAGSG
jgi:AcrR family transcriptional regulator